MGSGQGKLLASIGAVVVLLLGVWFLTQSSDDEWNEVDLEAQAINRMQWREEQAKLEEITKDLAIVESGDDSQEALLQEQIKELTVVVATKLEKPETTPSDEFKEVVTALAAKVRKLKLSAPKIMVEPPDEDIVVVDTSKNEPKVSPPPPKPSKVDAASQLIDEGQHAQALDVLFAVIGEDETTIADRQRATSLFNRAIGSAPHWWLIEPDAMAQTAKEPLVRAHLMTHLARAYLAAGDESKYRLVMDAMVDSVQQADSSAEFVAATAQAAMWLVQIEESHYAKQLADIASAGLTGMNSGSNRTLYGAYVAGVYARLGEDKLWKQQLGLQAASMKTMMRRSDKPYLSWAYSFAGDTQRAAELLDDNKMYDWAVYVALNAALDGEKARASQWKLIALESINSRAHLEDTSWAKSLVCQTEALLGQLAAAEARVRGMKDSPGKQDAYALIAKLHAEQGELVKAKRAFAAAGRSPKRADAGNAIGKELVRQNTEPAAIAEWMAGINDNFARYSVMIGVYAEAKQGGGESTSTGGFF